MKTDVFLVLQCLLLLAALGQSAARSDALLPDWKATLLEGFDQQPFSPALSFPPEQIVQRDFQFFRFTLFRGSRVNGASACWQFQPRHSQAREAALTLHLPAGAAGIAIWLKNPEGFAAELFWRVTDAEGRTRRSRPRFLQENKNWRRYVFTIAELTAEEPGLLLPLQNAELVLGGLQPGVRYTFYLDELSALEPPPPQMHVTEFATPSTAQAGTQITVQLAGEITSDLLQPLSLEIGLYSEQKPVLIKRLVWKERAGRVAVSVTLPRHIASGSYQWQLSAEGAKLTGPLTQPMRLTAEAGPQSFSLRPLSQGGGIAVEGQSLPLIGGLWRTGAPPEQCPWLMLPVTSDFDFTDQCPPVWLGPDKFDYAPVERRLALALGANPEAYLLPIVSISSPIWWDEQHPKELMIFGDNKPRLPAGVPGAKRTYASWASAVWRRDAKMALQKLIAHLESGPWGPAIMGYQLAAGEEGRWIYPGALEGVFSDYSAPQQEAFRQWLKNKYKDLATLRAAWGQPREPVTSAEALKEIQPILGWSHVRIPSPARRLRAPSGALHDPAAAQDIVDYQIFSSDLVAETICEFARAAKEACGDKKLVGVAYGHLFDLASTRIGLQNGGHLALSPILGAQELDFIVSPGTSAEASSLPLAATAVTSIAHHGKLWIAQGTGTQATATIVQALTQGGMAAVEALPEASFVAQIQTLSPTLPRRSRSEIAVILDDISAAYTAAGTDLVKPLLADQRVGLALMGAPYDVWMLDDVLSGLAIGYKLYIFLNAFYLDAAAREQLVKFLSEQKATALWIYAPGALEATMSARHMKALTGLTLIRPLQVLASPRKENVDFSEPVRTDRGPLRVKVSSAESYLYGLTAPITPRFACLGDKADIRGVLVGTQWGGLAVTEHQGFKSIWSAAPHLPASLLRSLAQEADVHIYAEAGVGVYANESWLALRGPEEETYRVQLPQLADVMDVASGQALGPRSNVFSVKLKAGELRLYYWGTLPLKKR